MNILSFLDETNTNELLLWCVTILYFDGEVWCFSHVSQVSFTTQRGGNQTPASRCHLLKSLWLRTWGQCEREWIEIFSFSIEILIFITSAVCCQSLGRLKSRLLVACEWKCEAGLRWDKLDNVLLEKREKNIAFFKKKYILTSRLLYLILKCKQRKSY